MKHKIKNDLKRILEKIDGNDFDNLKEDIIDIYQDLVIWDYKNRHQEVELKNEEINDFSKNKYPLLYNNDFEKKLDIMQDFFELNEKKEEEIKIYNEIEENSFKSSILNNDKIYTDIVLGFNDRISFQKNLFNNDAEILENEIKYINSVSSKIELEGYLELLKNKYSWNVEKQEYKDRFSQIVLRKFEI